VRLEPFFIAIDRRAPSEGGVPPTGAYTSDLALQARVSVRYTASERASFKLAWGRYFQAPQAEDQSPVFGNPLLSVANATHYLVSSQVSVLPQLTQRPPPFIRAPTA